MANLVEHQLKIVPADDGRGFFIVSNKRTMFMDTDMLKDLQIAVNAVRADGKEWRNYEESKLPPIPYEVTGKARLEDLL